MSSLVNIFIIMLFDQFDPSELDNPSKIKINHAFKEVLYVPVSIIQACNRLSK